MLKEAWRHIGDCPALLGSNRKKPPPAQALEVPPSCHVGHAMEVAITRKSVDKVWVAQVAFG